LGGSAQPRRVSRDREGVAGLDAADYLGMTTAQVNDIQNACEAVEID
jgi:hypothetical protein